MSSAEALMGRIETAKGKAAKRAFSQACRLYGKTKPRTLPELRSSTETFVGALQDVLGAELLGDILPLEFVVLLGTTAKNIACSWHATFVA